MHFTQAVAIVIPGEFASSMVHTLMAISPALQTRINAVLIRIHQGTGNDGVFDEGLDGLLLHIGQQLDHDLTTALYHPKHWRNRSGCENRNHAAACDFWALLGSRDGAASPRKAASCAAVRYSKTLRCCC